MIVRSFMTSFALSISATFTHAQAMLSDYTQDVLTHVVLHELGHALIREFDLPVLANEEIMADAFATVYVVQNMPDRATEIVQARAHSWALEMDEETVFSEHPDDVWRAGQMICLAYGLAPDEHDGLARDSGMSEDEAASCRDTAPEIGRAWRRMIAPLRIPSDAMVTEFRGSVEDGPWKDAFLASDMIEELGPILASFDWHSQITLQIGHCDSGASWSRNGRNILVCDGLIARFENQNQAN